MASPTELVPRQLFPTEMVRFVNVCCAHTKVFCYIKDSSPSTDSSRDASPDVDEVCSICCSCKSTCQRRNCLVRMVACFAERDATVAINETRVKIE